MNNDEFDPVAFINSLDEMVNHVNEGKLVPGLVALGFVLEGETISMKEFKEKKRRMESWHGKDRRRSA